MTQVLARFVRLPLISLVAASVCTAQNQNVVPAHAATHPSNAADPLPESAPSTEQLQAIELASLDARKRMIDLIASESFHDQLPLGAWLDRGGLQAALEEVAVTWSISSPRAIAPGIMQVRLEITGPKLRASLLDVARRRQAHPTLLARIEESHPLFDRAYVAVGNSSTPQVILSIDDLNAPTAHHLDSPESQAIIRRAAADAMLKRLRLDPRWHDLDMDRKLREPERIDRLRMTVAEFPADITDAGPGLVRVRLKFEARQLVEALTDVTRPQNNPSSHADHSPPSDPRSLAHAQIQTDPRLTALANEYAAAAVAFASLPSNNTSTPVILPDQPPAWISMPLTVSASAPPTGSMLRTARSAEREARTALRGRILNLPLNPLGNAGPANVGEWIALDPVRASFIDEWVEAAQTSGIDYAGDGSATARITLDPAPIWNLIRPR